MIIEHIDPRSPSPLFTAYVSKHGLFFHQTSWVSCYSSNNLRQCAILNKNREMIGCFLYYRFRKLGFNCIITPPHTPDIALHFVNPGASPVGKNSFVKELMAALAAYFRDLRVSYISINLPHTVLDTQPFLWKGFVSRSRHTYVLDLERSEEELLAGLSGEKRKSLSKAAREGVAGSAARNAAEVLAPIESSLGRSGKTGNLEILRRIVSTLLPEAEVISRVCEREGEIAASTFCVNENGRTIYLFGGYLEKHKSTGAHVSCMWETIKSAKTQGAVEFDFEGSMDPGIERYFREYGGELKTYQCVERVSLVMKWLLFLKGHKVL